MKLEKSLVTIGITCFNSEEFIERAILSAINQSWKNKEIIIVDDGSIDSSREILRKFSYIKNLKIIENEHNEGFPSCLNKIIDSSNGDYIAFFDDDDFSHEDRILLQMEKISSYDMISSNNPIVCYTNRDVYIQGEKVGRVSAIGNEYPEPIGIMVVYFLMLGIEKTGFNWGEFGSCTMLCSRDILDKYRFDPDFKRCAEWDFAIRVALDNGKFVSVNKSLVQQNKTISSDKSGKIPLYYSLLIRKKHRQFLKNKKIYISSIFSAYARFYFFRNKKIAGRLFLCLSRFFLLNAKK